MSIDDKVANTSVNRAGGVFVAGGLMFAGALFSGGAALVGAMIGYPLGYGLTKAVNATRPYKPEHQYSH